MVTVELASINRLELTLAAAVSFVLRGNILIQNKPIVKLALHPNTKHKTMQPLWLVHRGRRVLPGNMPRQHPVWLEIVGVPFVVQVSIKVYLVTLVFPAPAPIQNVQLESTRQQCPALFETVCAVLVPMVNIKVQIILSVRLV